MFHGTVFCVPRSEAIRRAAVYLSEAGLHVVTSPAPDVTYMLLPVPSVSAGDQYLAHILADLPDDVIISGGNLTSPLLKDYAVVDFLQDPYYLAENAAITASCTLKILHDQLGTDLSFRRILITGWGRIGKCMSHLLEKEDAEVTVAVRKDSDRAMLGALGYRGIFIKDIVQDSQGFDAVINTVPAMILPDFPADASTLILELASRPGISGSNITDCRGLPAKMAPEASGKLIAKTFLRVVLGKQV